MKRGCLFLAASGLLLAQPAPVPDASALAAKADAYVQSFVRDGKFAGSVIVIKEGRPVFRKGYGLANAEWEIPNGPDTKFRLGSITKQFTAIAILQLAEQGKLSLDDPISKHYDAPPAWEKITVHHLLNHTSGIPSYTSIKGFFQEKSRDPRTPVEITRLTQDQPLEFEPGSRFKYNNTAFVLLGHLVEKLSGMKYDQYLQTRILGPAGMKDTGYDWPAAILKKRASGYTPDGKNAPYLDMSLPHAAGSMYSTVDDFVKWDRILGTDELVRKDSWSKMTTPYKGDYGYGLIIKPISGHTAYSHGGGINGFNTEFIRLPDDKLAAAVFANINGPAAGQIANSLVRLYLGEDIKPPEAPKEITLSGEKLSAFPGTYELSPEFRIRIALEGAQLTAQATNQPKFPAFPYEENKFFLKVVDARLEFIRGAGGKVESVILHQGGRSMPGKRVGD